MNCPVCQKEFISETGRRPRKFCSEVCKIKFWNSKKVSVKNLNKQSTGSNQVVEKKEAQNESINTNNAPISQIEKEFQNILNNKK